MAKKKSRSRGGATTLYGVVIQDAIASGQLTKMRAAARAAEKQLAKEGNVAAALEALKIEIAKLEAGG